MADELLVGIVRRPHGERLLVAFEGVDDAAAARELQDGELSIPGAEAMAPPEGFFYAHEVAGWDVVPSQVVAAPSLAQSPAHLECRVREIISRGDQTSCFSGVHIVLAEVVCITADESILAGEARIDPTRVRAVGRMGFPWFVTAVPEAMFEQDRIAYADLVSGHGRQEGALATGAPD